MNKLFVALPIMILLFLIYSCSQNEKSVKEIESSSEEFVNQRIPDSIKRNFSKYLNYTLQGTFQISSQENYSLNVLNIDYNGDKIIDKIISINRLDKANIDLKNDDNPSKMLEMGQMGNYNHLILYNGFDSLFYSPITIPSSPYLPLSLSSISLRNDFTSEIQVDYRIRNAAYRSIYSINGNQAKLIFQWKLFDGLGTSNPEAYFIEIAKSGRNSSFKDINIYKAKLSALPAKTESNTYEPNIEKNGTIFTTFFFVDAENKYFTTQKK